MLNVKEEKNIFLKKHSLEITNFESTIYNF